MTVRDSAPERQQASRPRLGECFLDPSLLSLAARAPHAYVAIETSGGPHVTPVLFALTADRLWFVVARSTLKARVLDKRPAVGVLIDDGESVLVVGGDATVLDPLRPRDLATRLPELARAPLALPSYGLRNPAELLAFARDAAREPARATPTLALVSVRPGAIEVAASVSGKRPPAPGRRRAPVGQASQDWTRRLADIPEQAARLALERGPGVLGWLTPDGPVALPAGWEPETARVRVSRVLLERPGLSRQGPACLCLDTGGKGPAAKEGVLLRGPGRTSVRGGVASVHLETERITYWSGFDTGTVTKETEPEAGAPTAG